MAQPRNTSQTQATPQDLTLGREFELSMVDLDETLGADRHNGHGRVGSNEAADIDDVDDDGAELADDESDDDQAEMVNDDDEYDDEAESALDEDVDEFDDEAETADELDDDEPDEDEPDDVGDNRAAVRASRRMSRERTSTSTTEPKRRTPHMSPQLADGVRYLLNRYELAHAASIPQNVAVVSALSGEGVTTVSQALAEVLAVDFSVSVCWVDMSWTSNRRGSARNGVSSDPGLYDVLVDRAELDDVLVSAPGSAVTYLLPGDVADDDRHAMVRWPHLGDVVADLRGSFDHVVFDSAPLLANSDALALLRYVDAHLLVTKHGATTIRQVKATAAELETIPSLGALLNKYNPSTPSFIRRLFSE